MKLFCSVAILACAFSNASFSQINPADAITYVDSSCGCSFLLPNWFTVRHSAELRDYFDVLESGEFSFCFTAVPFPMEDNPTYNDEVGRFYEDTADAFLQAVRQATFFSGVMSYHGLVQYARLDSLREFTSVGGLRVIATYRTIVDLDGVPVDYDRLGPLYFVDTSKLAGKAILELDFSWFDMTNNAYQKLALSVALSVRPR